jgi:hypothetical protein
MNSHRVLSFLGPFLSWELWNFTCSVLCSLEYIVRPQRDFRVWNARAEIAEDSFFFFLPPFPVAFQNVVCYSISRRPSPVQSTYGINGTGLHSAPRLSSTFVRCASAFHLLVKQSPLANTNHPLVPIYSENNFSKKFCSWKFTPGRVLPEYKWWSWSVTTATNTTTRYMTPKSQSDKRFESVNSHADQYNSWNQKTSADNNNSDNY